jgi:hypothetical protein
MFAALGRDAMADAEIVALRSKLASRPRSEIIANGAARSMRAACNTAWAGCQGRAGDGKRRARRMDVNAAG